MPIEAVATVDGAARMSAALAAALDGQGPAVLPIDPGSPQDVLGAARVDEPLEDAVALLVPTSGSTGVPKVAELTGDALRASGTATHARFGGPGRWLLAVPLTHVAGVQVLARSALAGHDAVAMDLSRGFRPETLPDAVARMDAADAALGTRTRRYISLVPTQLHRVLDDPAATEALASLDTLLLGGAAAPVPLLERAREAGVTVVTSYGMTETAGGCVYDGRPLDGVRAALAEDGRIRLGGTVLARGYRGLPQESAEAFRGGWFTTADLGEIGPDGLVQVLGRADDVAISGGEKVVLGAVESCLAGHPQVREAAVVAVPDLEWGERIVGWVIPAAGAGPDLPDVLRSHVRASLGRSAVPRDVRLVGEFPRLALGKVDRAGLRAASR